MYCTLLKAKLHHLRVTEANKEYEGSLTIDEDLMDAVGILNYEKVLIANLENGERMETYAIRGPRGSGVTCLNGAAAYKGVIGDRLIVLVWCQLDETERQNHHPKVVRLDEKNRIVASAV
jgi:aspartate 1-decarboxylase